MLSSEVGVNAKYVYLRLAIEQFDDCVGDRENRIARNSNHVAFLVERHEGNTRIYRIRQLKHRRPIV